MSILAEMGARSEASGICRDEEGRAGTFSWENLVAGGSRARIPAIPSREKQEKIELYYNNLYLFLHLTKLIKIIFDIFEKLLLEMLLENFIYLCNAESKSPLFNFQFFNFTL